jgi:hypothetical protein
VNPVGSVLIVIHIAAAILFIGPMSIASSMFPGYVPAEPGVASRHPRSSQVAVVLHRVSRIYGVLSLIVPAAGIALAIAFGKFTEPWLIIAMVLTAVAGVLFATRIVPAQASALESPPTRGFVSRLGALTGVFNLLWVAVLVLMILRPGDTHQV